MFIYGQLKTEDVNKISAIEEYFFNDTAYLILNVIYSKISL